MKLSRETKIWVGTVIVLALILQVVTYVKYNKLESQVAGFHESLAVAQDESEAANAYDVFYNQTTPLLKAQEADAGCGWSVFIGKCWVWGRTPSSPVSPGRPRRVTPDPNSGLGTPNPTGPTGSGNCGAYATDYGDCTSSTGATGPGGNSGSGSGTLCLPGSSLRECQGRGAEQN